MFVLIFFLLLLLINYVNIFKIKTFKEKFEVATSRDYFDDYKTKTLNKQNLHCVNQENYGICIDNNNNYKCVKGDVYGPYFCSNCVYWVNKRYPKTIKSLGKNKITITRPWNYLYPNNTFDYFGEKRKLIHQPRYN